MIHHPHETLMRYARQLGFGKIHTKIDRSTGLYAIIAIHSTQLGPAIGGTRCVTYPNSGLALYDALRLAYHMTLKAAISDLAHGGAKSVIMQPKKAYDRTAIFQSFGDFVHEMNGQYIAAVDSGTTEKDMDIIAERTPNVFGASHSHPAEKDPSPYTAIGVLKGIEACVKFKLQRDTLENIHVAIQGAGHVGFELARLLTEKGARITICDTRAEHVRQSVSELGACAVPVNEIYDVPCDVFSPCALGGTINWDTINRLHAPIIAGSANTQLAHKKYGELLVQKGILYAPDFVINSGGLIYAAMVYDYQNAQMAMDKIDGLSDTLLHLFERAARENLPTQDVAEMMAKERLQKSKNEKSNPAKVQ